MASKILVGCDWRTDLTLESLVTLGLSTYAFSWRMHPDNPDPFTISDVLNSAASLGVGLVQVCDQPALEASDPARVRRLTDEAASLGLELELGTKGIEVEHLVRFLDLAVTTGARFVRSMLSSPRGTPAIGDAISALRSVTPAYERAGVTLGLETYEQFSTDQLVSVMEAVDSPALGICLDPGNSVARLEHPNDVIAKAAQYVVNLHVKDFAFSRKEGMIGFTFAGAPLGAGMLDYDFMVSQLESHGRIVNQIVEHWLTRQETLAQTCELEEEWVRNAVAYLSSRHRFVNPAMYPTQKAHHD